MLGWKKGDIVTHDSGHDFEVVRVWPGCAIVRAQSDGLYGCVHPSPDLGCGWTVMYDEFEDYVEFAVLEQAVNFVESMLKERAT